MDAKWEAAIDLTLRRLVYGSLAGGAAGLLLFRACPSLACLSRSTHQPINTALPTHTRPNKK